MEEILKNKLPVLGVDSESTMSMSEEELLRRCKEQTSRRKIHWTSEIYGFGAVLRRYGFYPKNWPLNIYMAHGLTMGEQPAVHELDNTAAAMLYFSPRLVESFKKVSTKPVHCVISPNVYYRRAKKIEKDRNARGTLAFLAHTTEIIQDRMNMVVYARQLKTLPEKYQPVTLCLHYHDINKGVHKTFLNEGLGVVTVGSPYHDSFIERFYDIVKCFRYTTSNEIGSYTFYCPEMGIPFFLYGAEPDLYNHGDHNIELGKYESYKKTNQYKKVRALFEKPVDEVTDAQRALVEEELGVHHTVSRLKMMQILYFSYVRLKYLKLKIFVYKAVTFHWLNSVSRFVRLYMNRLSFHFSNYRDFGFEFAKSLWSNSRSKKVTLFGKTLSYTNQFWFCHSMREIFLDKCYWFESVSPTPLIIDCGANIGLSVIYFKQLHPASEIIAFEPDVSNFHTLERNVRSFGLSNVHLYNKAVWTKDDRLQFTSSDNSVGSKLTSLDGQSAPGTFVEAVALSTYLKDRIIDFLKIDIEGAEVDVVRSCAGELRNVRNLFIEYHSLPDQPQQLHQLLEIIHDAGFRYYMKEAWENLKYPYVLRQPAMFDLQLNIFAYR